MLYAQLIVNIENNVFLNPITNSKHKKSSKRSSVRESFIEEGPFLNPMEQPTLETVTQRLLRNTRQIYKSRQFETGMQIASATVCNVSGIAGELEAIKSMINKQ